MTPYEHGLAYVGLKEIKGSKHNPVIIDFFKAVGHGWVKDDETSWCAAFVGAMLVEADLPYLKTLAARDYQGWGNPTSEPSQGDLCVLWREKIDSWKGHVGFVDHVTDKSVFLLGGNQSNTVKIGEYPLTRVLAFRTYPGMRKDKSKKSSSKMNLLATILTFLRGVLKR